MPAEPAVVDVLYVTGNSAHKVTGNSAHFEHWNKLPDSVLFDVGLSLAARCVYAMLAGAAHHGNIAKLGQRRISQKLGIHKETVGLALKELEKSAYIKISGVGRSRRSYSVLPASAAHRPEDAPAKLGSTRGQSRVNAGVSCPRCHKPRPALLRVGICRSCNLDLRLDRKVDTAVDKRLRATA